MSKISILFDLPLSVATRTILLENGISTLKDLKTRCKSKDLYKIKGFGPKRISEVSTLLKNRTKKDLGNDRK